MPSDISRTSDEARYDGVVLQQGRVILDRDFNALRETLDRRIADDALDIVGPCGTPDNGFAIGPAPTLASPVGLPLWSPPRVPTSPPSASPYDFSIGAGTMYVGGQRAVFAPEVPGQGAVEYSYFDQPNWAAPPPPPKVADQEFIYLHLLETEVSAVEDSELKDVALGGPDTTQRRHLVKRVKRLPVGSADCAIARQEAARTWAAAGLAFDAQTMRLLPQATLQVSYAEPTVAANPCDPVAQGGYLGADNQLIRVQVIPGGPTGSGPGLVWGYDNASFLYRARVSPQTPNTVVLDHSPVDAFHIPQQGQVVEILRCAFIIDTEPNAGDPQAPDTIRCVAESTGLFVTLTAPYQPDTLELSLSSPLPADYLNDENPLFVRIWQSQIEAVTTDGTTLYPLQCADGSQTGVEVLITTPGNALPLGAYWMFAVRPSTPQAVYPERFLIRPQAPDGPRQWICPLATITWSGATPGRLPDPPTFHDCRNTFCNLVDACNTHRDACCTVTVRPADLAADPGALQRAADQYLDRAAGVALCFASGTFTLAQPLKLTARHTGLSLHACHGGVTLQASTDAKPEQFLHGLIVLAGAERITLKGLSLTPVAIDLAAALRVAAGAVADNLRSSLARLENPTMQIGLRLQEARHLLVEDCEFQFAQAPGATTYGAAIFATGDCTGLNVRGCRFMAPARHPPIITIRPLTDFVRNATPAAVATLAAAPPVTAAPATATAAPAAEFLERYPSLFHVAQGLAPGVLDANDPASRPIEIDPTARLDLPSMLAAFLLAPAIDPAFEYRTPTNLIGGFGARAATLLSQAVLTEARFVDNRLTGLGVGILAAANMGSVAFLGNDVTDCYGGLWCSSLNEDIVGDAGAFQAWLGSAIQQGEGAAIALMLALWYRLPAAIAVKPLAPLSPQIRLLNNRIEAIPGDRSPSGPACLLNIGINTNVNPGAAAPTDVDSCVLFDANQVRNISSGETTGNKLSPLYGASVFLMNAASTVVSGNIIRNLAPLSATGLNTSWSLYVRGCAGGLTAEAGNIKTGKFLVTPP
jgi:Family of unknown function (DUF6519)